MGEASRLRLQAFPLLAERRRLEEFCDAWFNAVLPPEVAVFRPLAPLVVCTILYYGEMGGELAWRTGTMSQSEVYFLFFLERWRRTPDGTLEFVEYGATTPYIFVDNAQSAVVGRERFGFPKQACQITTHLDAVGMPWAAGVQHYLSVLAWEPGVAGQRLAPLLSVLRSPPRGPAGARLLSDSAVSLPQPSSVGRADMVWAVRAAIAELEARTSTLGPRGLWSMARGLWSMVRGGNVVNVFNVRQFADPEWKDAARYIDLVRMRMRVGDVQGFGLLGEHLGATSDFHLMIHRSGVTPITSRLGLRIDLRRPAFDAVSDTHVDLVTALAPIYAQGNVDLIETRRLCWRTGIRGWRDDDGRPLGSANVERPRYNEHLGPSAAAFLEPQPQDLVVDMKVLMLPACREQTKKWLESLVPETAPVQLEPVSHGEFTCVRLLVYRSRPRPERERGGLVWLDGSYAELSVPIDVTIRERRERVHFLLHDFTDNGFLVQALRELVVGPTSQAKFELGEAGWFGTTRGVVKILGLTGLAMTRTAAAAQVRSQPLFDVFMRQDGQPLYPPPAYDADALRTALWPAIERTLPRLTVGSITRPDDETHSVTRRIMLTTIDEQPAEGVRGPPSHGPAQYFVQFHDTESYPAWREAGLVSLHDPRLEAEVRVGVAGRTHVVPAIAIAETAMKVRVRRMEVVWASTQPDAQM